jgi:hypothetical protein
LKILIHGQETETLAGHLDLSQAFLVNANAVAPRAAANISGIPASTSAAQELTPAETAVKLATIPDNATTKR